MKDTVTTESNAVNLIRPLAVFGGKQDLVSISEPVSKVYLFSSY